MAITIRDIAKKVGVSPSTVSRVMNGKGVISEETCQKINLAVEELHYYPNSLARNFANNSTYAIGLVINAQDEKAFSNAFFTRSVFAIEKVAQNNGYNLIITNDHEEGRIKSSIDKLVFEKRVDGIILPSAILNAKLIQKLQSQDFPFVVLGQPGIARKACCWVDVDNTQGAELAVQHLLEQGYRKIAFITDNRKAVFVQNRLNGYRNGLAAAGIPIEENDILECSKEDDDCLARISALLQSDVPPDAFVCCDNILAFYVMRAAGSLGLKIPEEIGVLSFDNFPIAEYTEPSLTVIDVDTFHLGELAAAILIRKIERDNSVCQQTLISTRLIKRQSTSHMK